MTDRTNEIFGPRNRIGIAEYKHRFEEEIQRRAWCENVRWPEPLGEVELVAQHEFVRVFVSDPRDAAVLAQQNLKIASLETDVADLRASLAATQAEVAALHASLGLSRDSERTVRELPELDPGFADLLSVTHELFPGTPKIELQRDPEDPENPHVVLTVTSDCEPDDIAERRIQWHRRIDSLAPTNSGMIRLSVVPRWAVDGSQ